MYETHFGLTASPFQHTPDPAFFFGSTGHRRAKAYLDYGVNQGEGFVVVTGDVGAGKATLIQTLLRDLDTQSVVAAKIASTQPDGPGLLRTVAQRFGMALEAMDKAAILGELKAFLRGLHASGRQALLVVDEVQNLSRTAIEELRMLSSLQAGNKALLQSFLVGQSEFRRTMQRPEMPFDRLLLDCFLFGAEEISFSDADRVIAEVEAELGLYGSAFSGADSLAPAVTDCGAADTDQPPLEAGLARLPVLIDRVAALEDRVETLPRNRDSRLHATRRIIESRAA